MKKRTRHTAEFKSKVVLEVLREEATINEIASKHGIAPTMLNRWKAEFLESAHRVFERDSDKNEKRTKEFEEKEERLQKLVGQLTVEIDWLKKKSGFK